jgi:hypothetical protein
MNLRSRLLLVAICAGLWAALGAVQADAQAKQGPLQPPPDAKVTRIPAETKPEAPPPMPVEDIIKAFSQKEELFLEERSKYVYQRSVRVVEYGQDGKPAGDFQYTVENKIDTQGGHSERMVKQPEGTLPDLVLQPEDLDTLWRAPLFPFTPGQIANYVLTYAGKEQVDELTTYLFQVKPKQVDRAHAYFDGLIWVDDHDLAIVKVYGKWVTETGPVFSKEAPFTFFETYRENVDGKFWFPTYVRSDAMLKVKDREIPLRLTVRWTNIKPIAAPPEKKPQ